VDGRTVEEVWKERRSSGVEPGIDTTTATPARDRSAAEFESLLRAHDRAVRAMAFRIVGTDVDDVLQQAYLKAFLCWDRFRGDATFGTWLHRIVYTTCLDHVRSSDRRHRTHERAAVRDRTADTTDAVADLIVLAQAVDALPVDQRVGQGMSYEDAAVVLAVAAGTIASRLSRARATVRARLSEGEVR
jgi:RNA polymerase sigma-70 factor, ECF subfamily